MNPRQFCREQAFPKALLLTFSIDGFFEQVILQDLAKGRSSDVLVIADQSEIDRTLGSGQGQFTHLGKRYMLTSVAHDGAFHPKMVFRLGPTEGRVLIGTGNLTSAGWGANLELASAWKLGSKYEDNGAWLPPLFDELSTWCATDMERDSLRRIADVPWLKNLGQAGPARVMHSTRIRALAPLLAERWSGRRFDEVRILTGSTDERGAFLRWAHATFGVRRATVALSPANASFTRDAIADLPIDLRLIPMPSDRSLHAKFYWFDGPTGPAAIMGSANCGAAAWLVPSSGRGNMELVVPYDSPDPIHFASILSIFERPSAGPEEVLAEPRTTPEVSDEPGPRHVLSALRWSARERAVTACMTNNVPSSASVQLHIGPLSVDMHFVDGIWQSEQLELDFSSAPIGHATIDYDEQVFTTPMRWVDHLDELQRTVETSKFLTPIRDLDRDTSSKEQQRLVNELNELSRALLQDTAGFQDIALGRPDRDRNDGPGDEPRAVDADSLVRAIAGSDWAEAALGASAESRAQGLSLSGILGLLFEAESRAGGPPPSIGPDAHPNGPRPADRAVPPRPAGATFRKSLAAGIETFLVELARDRFLESCTVTRLVQAVSFPLAVAVLGQKRGWVDPDTAERWAITIVQMLLHGRTTSDAGLLGRVEERYRNDGKLDLFDQVIGDGTLWLVLLSTFAGVKWAGVETVLDKAVLLRKAFRSPQLIASATPGRTSQLLSLLRVEDSRELISVAAPAVSKLLDAIEQIVTLDWDSNCRQQRNDNCQYALGDWLFRPNVGWIVCIGQATDPSGGDRQVPVRLRGEETLVKCSFYLNITALAPTNEPLRAHIAALRMMLVDPAARNIAPFHGSPHPTSPG